MIVILAWVMVSIYMIAFYFIKNVPPAYFTDKDIMKNRQERIKFIEYNYSSHNGYYFIGKGAVPYYEISYEPHEISFYDCFGHHEKTETVPEEFRINGQFKNSWMGRFDGYFIFYSHDEHSQLIYKYNFLQYFPAVILSSKYKNREIPKYVDEEDAYRNGKYRNSYKKRQEAKKKDLERMQKEFNGKSKKDKPFHSSFPMSIYEDPDW